MPSVAVALNTRLRASAGLTALIGGATPRIYWKKSPQTALYPHVTFQRISGGPRVSAMGHDTGLSRPRYQFTVWAQAQPGKGPSQVADEVAEQVRLALQRFRGTSAGVEIQDIFIADDRDMDNPEVDVAGKAIDAFVWARETVP